MRNIVAILVACCGLVYTGYGQQKEMSTDRPDQTEETSLVSKGGLQIETGVLVNRFDSGRSAVINRTLIRYGISKKIEAGLLLEQGRERNRYIEEIVQSTYPLALRVKVSLLEKHAWLPDMTLVGYLELPYTTMHTKEGWRRSSSVVAAFLHEIGSDWKLEYNAGFQQEAFSPDLSWLVNGSLHYQPAEKIELFAGYFSQYQPHENPFHNLDAGIAYKVRDNIQLDIAGGASIAHADANQFVTIGFSIAIPR